MWKMLAVINKNLILSITMTMVAGFLYGLFFPAENLSGYILLMTFIMVLPMMTTLRLKNLAKWNDIKTQLLTQFINFGIIPFIAFGMGRLFFPEKPLYALGMLLASLLPTSGMTISWTGFAKGNLEAAVKMTVLGLTLGSIAMPFYLSFLAHQSVSIDTTLIIRQIVLIVFVPMMLGHFIRQFFVKKVTEPVFQKQYAPRFSSISTLGVLGIVFISVSLKAPSLVESPLDLLHILGPVILLYLVNFFISTLIAKCTLPRADAIALVYGTVMRNISIALAIALNSFGKAGPEIALVITTAFIVQIQLAAWYVKYTSTFFGMPPPNNE